MIGLHGKCWKEAHAMKVKTIVIKRNEKRCVIRTEMKEAKKQIDRTNRKWEKPQWSFKCGDTNRLIEKPKNNQSHET